MSAKQTRIVLLVLYLAGVAAFGIGAVRQRADLNLSATAGGQFPYLVYAEGIATEGVTQFVGDRNRLPVVPTIVSLVHDDDWATFANRASLLSIALSLGVLAGVALIAHRILRPFSAAAVTLSAAFGVYMERASFVQAEPTYYGLFLLTLWLMIRCLRAPTIGRAAVCGAVLGLTYLTKASALPLLPAFAIFVGMAALRNRSRGHTNRLLPWAIVVAAVGMFLLVASPYLAENQSRFGRVFYNVNSTFFMWCDSWGEASDFAEAHDIATAYPDAPLNEIPGPLNYWRSHTTSQIVARMRYGLGVLARETFTKRFGIYLVFSALVCGIAATGRGWRRTRLLLASPENRLVFVFSCAISLGYLLSYVWYVPIGYGDRFVQSLFMPAMCAMLFVMQRLSGGRRVLGSWRLTDALGLALCGVVLVDGVVLAAPSASKPPPHFLEYYYNESVERERDGDDVEAGRGYAGIFQIDPAFITSIGRGALEAGRFADAANHLRRAAALDPDNPIVFNDLGSALVQSNQPAQAVAALQRATTLDPNLAVAWFNLGGTLIGLGRNAEAAAAIEHLAKLNPALAQRLSDLLPSP